MSVNLAAQRTYLEEITHTANDANFAGSTYELQLLTKAWQKSAYKYNWPQTLKRGFDAAVAYVDRYSLQSDFRKFLFLKSLGLSVSKTELEALEGSWDKYAVALDSLEYILGQAPGAASTVYSFSGSYSAGSAVVITLASVDGIAVGDEIYISDTTSSEFTKVQAVDSDLLTVTVKLANSHSNKTLYRVKEGNYFQYQKVITDPSTGTDVPPTPSNTHLIIPHYAAFLYYTDIEEPDRAKTHFQTWETELADAWLGLGEVAAGEVGEFTIG